MLSERHDTSKAALLAQFLERWGPDGHRALTDGMASVYRCVETSVQLSANHDYALVTRTIGADECGTVESWTLVFLCSPFQLVMHAWTTHELFWSTEYGVRLRFHDHTTPVPVTTATIVAGDRVNSRDNERANSGCDIALPVSAARFQDTVNHVAAVMGWPRLCAIVACLALGPSQPIGVPVSPLVPDDINIRVGEDGWPHACQTY